MRIQQTEAIYTETNLVSPCAADAGLETDVLPAGDEAFADVKPAEVIDSQTFAAALYDIYLGADGPLRGAREQWAAAARALMADDDTAGDTRAAE